jgi:hypothetical protein
MTAVARFNPTQTSDHRERLPVHDLTGRRNSKALQRHNRRKSPFFLVGTLLIAFLLFAFYGLTQTDSGEKFRPSSPPPHEPTKIQLHDILKHTTSLSSRSFRVPAKRADPHALSGERKDLGHETAPDHASPGSGYRISGVQIEPSVEKEENARIAALERKVEGAAQSGRLMPRIEHLEQMLRKAEKQSVTETPPPTSGPAARPFWGSKKKKKKWSEYLSTQQIRSGECGSYCRNPCERFAVGTDTIQVCALNLRQPLFSIRPMCSRMRLSALCQECNGCSASQFHKCGPTKPYYGDAWQKHRSHG